MEKELFLTISFVISVLAVASGAKVLLKKGIPLYFQLYLAAAGCYCLESLCSLITEICGGSEQIFSVSFLGLWGCLWFLFCANHGAMNGLINDGKKPAGWLYSIPVIHTLAILFIAYSFRTSFYDLAAAIIIALVMAPAIPVVFWNFSHIFAEEDDFGFRSKINKCDKASIIFNVALVIMFYSKTVSDLFAGIMTVICACAAALLVFAASKEAKQWNI